MPKTIEQTETFDDNWLAQPFIDEELVQSTDDWEPIAVETSLGQEQKIAVTERAPRWLGKVALFGGLGLTSFVAGHMFRQKLAS